MDSVVEIVAIVALVVVVIRQHGRLGLLEREIGALRSFVLSTPGAATAAAASPGPSRASLCSRSRRLSPKRLRRYPPTARSGACPASSGTGRRCDRPMAGAVRIGSRARRQRRQRRRPKRPDIETALGTRWAVWVGGLALALGGLFLIRYSIEAGIFGPGVRLTMAALLGLVLTGGGEFIRRTGFKVPVEGVAGAYVPGILTAAGAFTLFGTVYAAHGIYGFIGPAARLHAAGCDRHRRHRAGARPRPGAGRHRPARLDGHADPRLLAVAERLGAVRLPRHRARRQHRHRQVARLGVPGRRGLCRRRAVVLGLRRRRPACGGPRRRPVHQCGGARLARLHLASPEAEVGGVAAGPHRLAVHRAGRLHRHRCA